MKTSYKLLEYLNALLFSILVYTRFSIFLSTSYWGTKPNHYLYGYWALLSMQRHYNGGTFNICILKVVLTHYAGCVILITISSCVFLLLACQTFSIALAFETLFVVLTSLALPIFGQLAFVTLFALVLELFFLANVNFSMFLLSWIFLWSLYSIAYDYHLLNP